MKKAFSLLVICLLLFSGLNAQSKKASVKKASKYPERFSISKSDFDKLFTYTKNQQLNFTNNKYIHKSVLELNSQNGDMQLLRIKLNYFPKALLMVLVNGVYSTQVYITSSDKSLSYKGKIEKDQVLMTKCNRDEIVSE